MEKAIQELSNQIALAFRDKSDDPFSKNIVDGLLDIGAALRLLGNADAMTPMGAIEGHAVQVKEAIDSHAEAIREAGEAISDRSDIASAIRDLAKAIRGVANSISDPDQG
jgi:hypothetical protein